jgi:hypothetical protein
VRTERVRASKKRRLNYWGPGLCATDGCTNEAVKLSPYCPECRVAREVLRSHTKAGADARKNTPEMRRSVEEVRRQVALMAQRDPFYDGGPA